MGLSTTILFRRFRVNYIINLYNTLKLYLVKCCRKDRAVLPLRLVELGFYPNYTSFRAESGYLLYAFIINGRSFFNQGILKYQALSSSSSCFVPMIQTPFCQNFYNVEPKKYILAKRFNQLTYKILNNKCK